MKKLVVALLVSASAVSASASVVVYTDRAAFTAALSSSTTATFDDAPSGSYTPLGCVSNFGAFSASAANCRLYLIDSGFSGGTYTFGSGGALHNDTPADPTNFTIASGTRAFGLDIRNFYDFGSTVDISSEVGNFTVAGSQAGTFFGLISDTAFTSVIVNTVGNYTAFDNVTLGTAADVPEPAMLGLFGLGAIGLGLGRRKA